MVSMNCVKCGKIFNYLGSGPKICLDCKNKEEQLFQDVKKYIYENDNSTIQSVAEHFNIKQQLIQQWIISERLVIKKGSAIKLTCEICGEPILTGRFCAKCKAENINALSSMFNKPTSNVIANKPKVTGRAKMQFLNNK